ncbi:histidine phosphatase family protein [Chachezhania sediminis]|uniref:histidine phosphatase family protein n=1 Tax=Chachezhania sediminis TaxID=2599291 RepID=UPI00131DF1D8|nr:histidine phosphatase family protein [Chachezhania sediminis]
MSDTKTETKEYHQTKYAPPAGACDMLLIRHGRTMPAIPGESFETIDGHGNPLLHPEGEEQAVKVGERLKHMPISAIYVTTLTRTHQTAAPLAGHLGLTPRVEGDLREIFLGDWDAGLYRIMAAERHPAILRAHENHEYGEIPGAETTADFHGRVRAGLLRIAQAHPDELVAVVVHGGVIGAAMSIASESRPFSFRGAENGSISRLVIQGETMTIRGYNDIGHLD